MRSKIKTSPLATNKNRISAAVLNKVLHLGKPQHRTNDKTIPSDHDTITRTERPRYFTRIAQVEYRLMKIENTQAELENTMTPGGYITEAFDRVLAEIDEVKVQNQELKGMISEQNGKIDAILRNITGLGNS